MKLRIITGNLKGRYIRIKGAGENFRPTKEVVREAVADLLKGKINGAFIADFCAGSGAFGFEMLSRGAQYVHFVDNNRACCQDINNHARLFNIENQCHVFCKDVRSFLKTYKDTFDIIYYDPPYNNTELAEFIPNILPYISTNGILIFERKKTKCSNTFTISDDFKTESRKYGDTIIDLFSRVSSKTINKRIHNASCIISRKF